LPTGHSSAGLARLQEYCFGNHGIATYKETRNALDDWDSSSIGLKGTPDQLGLPRANFWIYPSTDHDGNVEQFLKDPQNAPFPVVYISFPAAKDHTPERFEQRWLRPKTDIRGLRGAGLAKRIFVG